MPTSSLTSRAPRFLFLALISLQRDSKLKAAEKELAKHKADLAKLRDALTKATQSRDEIALEVDALKEEIAGLEEQVAAHEETIKGLVADEEAAGDAVEAASEAFNMADSEYVMVVILIFFCVIFLVMPLGHVASNPRRAHPVFSCFGRSLLFSPSLPPQAAEEKGQAQCL